MKEQEEPESDDKPAIPKELDSASSKLVYLYIRLNEAPTIAEISEQLQMKKLTLYGVLKGLQNGGFVSRDGNQYTYTTS